MCRSRHHLPHDLAHDLRLLLEAYRRLPRPRPPPPPPPLPQISPSARPEGGGAAGGLSPPGPAPPAESLFRARAEPGPSGRQPPVRLGQGAGASAPLRGGRKPGPRPPPFVFHSVGLGGGALPRGPLFSPHPLFLIPPDQGIPGVILGEEVPSLRPEVLGPRRKGEERNEIRGPPLRLEPRPRPRLPVQSGKEVEPRGPPPMRRPPLRSPPKIPPSP